MFKVKKKEYVNKTFRMPDELIAELERVAQNEHISLNNLVVQCCRYALDNIADEEMLSVNTQVVIENKIQQEQITSKEHR